MIQSTVESSSHRSERLRFNRADWIAGVAIAIATIPVVFAPGAIYVAEPALFVALILGLFHLTRSQAVARLNTQLIAGGVALLGYSAFQLAIGLGGPFDVSAPRLRSYAIFVLGLAVVALGSRTELAFSTHSQSEERLLLSSSLPNS